MAKGRGRKLGNGSTSTPSTSTNNHPVEDEQQHVFPDNTTIFPIQLLDKTPRSADANRFILTSISEVEFEELRFYSNISSQLQLDIDQAIDEEEPLQVESSLSAKASGKRKAVDPSPSLSSANTSKKSRLMNAIERDDFLASTSLLFSLQPDMLDKSDLSSLFDSTSSISSLKMKCMPSNRGLESFVSNIVIVSNQSDHCLVELPIFRSFNVDPDRNPQNMTNSEWLPSAIALEAKGNLEIKTKIQLHETHPFQGSHEEQDPNLIFLELQVELYLTPSAFEPAANDLLGNYWLEVMRFCNPGPEVREEQRRSTLDASMIYSNLVSAEMEGSNDSLQPSDLHPTLIPFQRKAVEFMAGREGRFVGDVNQDLVGKVQTTKGPIDIGLFYEQVDDGLFFESLNGFFTRDLERVKSSNINGGIYSEEMGLGKTVEVFALILLNQSPERSSLPSYFSESLSTDVNPVSTTLIVAPETLRQQWIDEAALHAPSLRVYSYLGHVKATRDCKSSGLSWPKWIARDFDLVVISFSVLQREIHVAKKDESMARRKEPKYERSRSPLVQTEWNRVVMDEVQVLGPNSGAAQTVSMIPRRSSIAVSGTLVKQATDLQGTFDFLRVPISNAGFRRLLQPMMAPTLISVLQILATRTTKSQVQSELTIPPQVKQLISLDFTGIELVFYQDMLRNFHSEAGCDETGYLPPGHQFNPALLSNHLTRLRQACTHPQVVGRALGGRLGEAHSNLRSIDEVLSTMLESVIAEMNNDRILLVRKKIHRALLFLGDKEREDRLEKCKVILENLLPEVKDRISSLDGVIKRARIKGPTYDFTSEMEAEGKLRDQDDDDDEEEDSEEETSTNRSKTARRIRVSALKNRQREWVEQLHRLHQFLGNVYFQKGEQELKEKEELQRSKREEEGGIENEDEMKIDKESNSWKSLEDSSYASAESTRQLLLSEQKKSVDQCLSALDSGSTKLNILIDDFESEQNFGGGGVGLISSVHFDELDRLSHLLLNNAKLILDWRRVIIKNLRLVVNRDVSQENEEDDQYQENLDAQVEAETVLEMFRVLLAEREKIIAGTTSVGATSKPSLYVSLEHQMANIKRQRLQVSLQEGEEDDEGEKLVKQQLDHFKKLDRLRNKFKLKEGELSVEGVVLKLKEVAERYGEREAQFARRGISSARDLIKDQNLALGKLRKEVTLLTNLFNARAAYFKSIQELSDQVSDVTSADVEKDLRAIAGEEITIMRNIGKKEEKSRYLVELEKANAMEEKNEEARTCFICTDQINTGTLTPCGHLTCERCFKNWTSTNSICPVCRERISIKDTHRIVYRKVEKTPEQPTPQETKNKTNSQTGASANGSRSSKSYSFNEMNEDDKVEISRIPLSGRFGTKLDFLVQFLLRIERTSDDKTLIFSSFSRGLDFVGEALKRNAIPFVRLEGGGKQAGKAVERFRVDSTTNVLLLHSEAQSSGLNLLCATNVIILEPLVNHALELQAISRVSRIGATRNSQIYTLYINDTVEERILHLAAKRNRSLYVKNDEQMEEDETDVAILDVKARGGKDAKTSKGDFVSDPSDLLACLFDEKIFTGPLPTDPSSHQASTIGHPSQAQAQAGGSNPRPMDDLQARREERARAAEARASAFRAQQ